MCDCLFHTARCLVTTKQNVTAKICTKLNTKRVLKTTDSYFWVFYANFRRFLLSTNLSLYNIHVNVVFFVRADQFAVQFGALDALPACRRRGDLPALGEVEIGRRKNLRVHHAAHRQKGQR